MQLAPNGLYARYSLSFLLNLLPLVANYMLTNFSLIGACFGAPVTPSANHALLI
jgi:hypothetical protein